jgi:8-amino-7-oxononanoate synthase
MAVVRSWPSATTAVVNGHVLLSFAGCDYLGLSHHPKVIEALSRGLKEFGVAANGSRETTGTTSAHLELEEALAVFLGREAALVAPSGTLANLAACQGLAPSHRVALLDSQGHSSLLLSASACKLETFKYRHADASAFAEAIDAIGSPVLAMTDGVFGTTGAQAPVTQLLDLLPAQGRLLLDDSHALGVLGPSGQGTLAEHGLVDKRVVITASLGKAVGVSGGVVAGDSELIGAIRRTAGAYRGSTAMLAAVARAAMAAICVMQSESPVSALRVNVERARAALSALGVPVASQSSPIFNIVPRDATQATSLVAAASQAGLLLPLIDYMGGPAPLYFRFSISAAHHAEDIERLIDALRLGLQR